MLWAKLMQLLARNDAQRLCKEQGLIDEGYSREGNEARSGMGHRRKS